jgi:tetratricopeptide (TPR) repeat protein
MTLRARQFAAEGRLVVFVGAGVSSIPPTCLPSWWGLNRAVIVALRDRVAELVGRERAEALANAVTARQQGEKFPPEYQAEVIVGRLGHSYFNVLQLLDSTTPNAVHRAIAALAKEGRVSAVLTTNFDRALEAAFRELGVPAEVCSAPAHFQSLETRLAAPSERRCPILKLHGSAEDPATLVDTLSQRKRGFPPATAACIRHLLRAAHWLFLGYSGADLASDANYLFLRPDAAQAQGFTWLLRTGEKPVGALAATRDAYSGRSDIVEGELPDWLAAFAAQLLARNYPSPPQPSRDAVDQMRQAAAASATRHAADWVGKERFDRIVLVVANLLNAVGEPAAALDLVQRLYDTWPPGERRSGHFGVAIDSLANLYSQSGDLDRAVALFREALEIFDPTQEEEHHVLLLNNLALVYSKRGQAAEASEIYRRVLAVAEAAKDRAVQGVALHNLAMSHASLGHQDEAERLYEKELIIVQELGDEPAQGIVLNNLAELAVSRGRVDAAVEHAQAALRIRERLGADLGAAHSRGNLANVRLMQESHDEALQLYEKCLTTFQHFGERVYIGRTLANIARVKEATGRREEALGLLDRALREADATASDLVRAQVLQLRGEIEQKQGHNAAAAATFSAAVDLTVRMRDPKGERDARVGHGIAVKELGDFDGSIRLLRVALTLTRTHAFPALDRVLDHLGDALFRDGLARQHHGELETALRDFLEAAEISHQRKSTYNEAQSLLNVANTQALLERHPDAAANYQRAATLLFETGERDSADQAAFTAAQLYVLLDRREEASALFVQMVSHTANYAEWAERMNRIGALAGKLLEGGALEPGLWVLEECLRMNREANYPADVAACLINIGHILKATGDTDGARRRLTEAVSILEPIQHPMLAQARQMLEACGSPVGDPT